ncbi:MAG: mechanosensitive ion channel [Chloroflexota bacterium]
MEDILVQDILNQFKVAVPGVVGAVILLIVGFVVALLVSSIVRSAVRRLGLDRRIGGLMAGGAAPRRPVDTAPIIGRIVFWLIMLFVLIGFFQALSLTIITGPLAAFLALILGYVPLLVGAGILILVAWIVATILRALVLRLLQAMRLDERVSAGSGAEAGAGAPLSRSLAEAVYWLVFLFFLPAILSTLGLVGLLVPVQHLLDTLLGFLPNLFAAAILLVVGWFVARIVQRVVSSLLAAAGVDRFSERVGLASALGSQKLSGLIGLIVYILILLPIVIAALQALQLAAITAPATAMLAAIMLAIPKLFAAALTLVIAYIVGRVLAPLVANLLAAAGVDGWPARLGIARPATAQPTASAIGGQIVMVAIMLFALIEALHILAFAEVAVLLAEFTRLAGQILMGVIIFGVGLWLARLAAGAVRGSGTTNASTLAEVARWSILVLTGAMALREMGLAPEIINLAFGLLLGSVAVASAVAFGVGGRQVAGRELERFVESRRAAQATVPPPADQPPPLRGPSSSI